MYSTPVMHLELLLNFPDIFENEIEIMYKHTELNFTLVKEANWYEGKMLHETFPFTEFCLSSPPDHFKAILTDTSPYFCIII